MKMRIAKVLFCLLLASKGSAPALAREAFVRYSAPEIFSYEELVELGKDNEIGKPLADKLRTLTSTPFLNNEAWHRGAKPHRPQVKGLGTSLRVVFWNIERGMNLDEIKLLFSNTSAFLKKAAESRAKEKKEPQTQDPNDAQLRADIQVLQSADVILLNELDWGMKRTGYREVMRELGQALNMNWAYAVEFVEVDPKVLGTETFEMVKDSEDRKELLAEASVDKTRLRALHGTAILSRYPIRKAQARPFAFQGYDWYNEEKRLRPTEQTMRKGVTLLGETLGREMRRGGRNWLSAELDVPDLPEKQLTVIATHLENRTKPQNRRKQMAEILEAVREVKNPVVIAGDLNTTSGDSQAYRLEREMYKKVSQYDFWVNKGIKYGTGVGLAYDVMKSGFKFTKNQSDPTTKHVPYLAPNREEGLFTMLEEFRFADGRAFDFRGDPERTVNGQTGTLANSNQRAGKGFAHTYEFVKTVGVAGKYKLDWIFSKSYLEKPQDPQGPYRFAPHFAKTLGSVNHSLGKDALSDHNPLVADFPFQEPVGLRHSAGSPRRAGR